MDKDKPQNKQFRKGKTQKDHKSGAHARRVVNQDVRNAWCNDPKRTQASFPYEVCNGKRFPTRRTGKGGNPVITKYTGAMR